MGTCDKWCCAFCVRETSHFFYQINLSFGRENMSGGGKPSLYQQSQGGKLNIFLYATVGIYRWGHWTNIWSDEPPHSLWVYTPQFFRPNRYTVLLLDVVLFLLKAIGEVDFLTTELNVFFWTSRGIHQIGLSQCQSEALEGCFGRCGSRHWRRWALLTLATIEFSSVPLRAHGYRGQLMGTECYWLSELYWLLFRSWHWQGACSEAGWLGMSGGLCGQVGHISYVKCGGKGNKQSDQDEMWNWILLWAGRQKLTGAQWTRSKRQEVFVDHDGRCHGDHGDDGRCSIEDHGDCDWSLASGLAWAFQCDVSKREEVAEMARWGWTMSC